MPLSGWEKMDQTAKTRAYSSDIAFFRISYCESCTLQTSQCIDKNSYEFNEHQRTMKNGLNHYIMRLPVLTLTLEGILEDSRINDSGFK